MVESISAPGGQGDVSEFLLKKPESGLLRQIKQTHDDLESFFDLLPALCMNDSHGKRHGH